MQFELGRIALGMREARYSKMGNSHLRVFYFYFKSLLVIVILAMDNCGLLYIKSSVLFVIALLIMTGCDRLDLT